MSCLLLTIDGSRTDGYHMQRLAVGAAGAMHAEHKLLGFTFGATSRNCVKKVTDGDPRHRAMMDRLTGSAHRLYMSTWALSATYDRSSPPLTIVYNQGSFSKRLRSV